MPIRFHCKRCKQLLGIASRKAGSEIECPKCGLGQTVPSEEAAAVAMALHTKHANAISASPEDDFAVYDDAPEAVEVTRHPRRREPRTSRAAPNTPAAAPPVTEPAKTESFNPAAPSVPGGMILFPRRTLYVQGALVIVLALLFFVTGYFIGRGTATVEMVLEQEAALKERTLIEGRLVYRPEPQKVAGDERAVIVALPAQVAPEHPIPIHGIRPQDPDPPQSLRSLRLLDELGAVYTRANQEGDFDMIVPDQGEYYILLISRNVSRPRNADPDEADLLEIARYFTLPERLISRYKYQWAKYDVHNGMLPIEVDFGEEGHE